MGFCMFVFKTGTPKTDRLEKSECRWPVKSENALSGAFLVQVSEYSMKLLTWMSDEDFLDEDDFVAPDISFICHQEEYMKETFCCKNPS